MPLRVLPITKFMIGKFGGSFIDVHRIQSEQTKGQYLPQRQNEAVIGGAISVGMGTNVCQTGTPQNPRNRRIYSIDTTGLKTPIETCTTPEALDDFARQFRETVNTDTDDFLNRNINKDWSDSSGRYDILNSKYNNGVAFGDPEVFDSGDKLESVSAISFSVTADELNNWSPSYNNPIKVWFSKGTTSTTTSYGCETDQEISPPVIVTDTRNNAGLNIANTGIKNSYGYLRGNRLYLEIRHGLNTQNYLAMVNEPDFFVQIPKKNSLILSRFVDRWPSPTAQRVFGVGGESIFHLPKGRINVIFYASPCASSFNGVTQGIG